MPNVVKIRAPASKSVTHRAFILAGLGTGESTVRAPLMAHDTQSTLTGLKKLGVRYTVHESHIAFAGGGLQPRGPLAIDCGNSGTTLRLFMGLSATEQVQITLDGDDSLRKRPNAALAEWLRPQLRQRFAKMEVN